MAPSYRGSPLPLQHRCPPDFPRQPSYRHSWHAEATAMQPSRPPPIPPGLPLPALPSQGPSPLSVATPNFPRHTPECHYMT
ncbi:hypothetical protein GUJ93_ZPchr0014g46725 [Zizania palustris]|uniref:Uncharacterized protein n=1 Tax=Zizania palustris TaxID=103762 RepID=A0A8J5W6R3_ZIZPA|nr:hypothetical protein GUJ93_ZPchr0014g46725 [Zizania palustris]